MAGIIVYLIILFFIIFPLCIWLSNVLSAEALPYAIITFIFVYIFCFVIVCSKSKRSNEVLENNEANQVVNSDQSEFIELPVYVPSVQHNNSNVTEPQRAVILPTSRTLSIIERTSDKPPSYKSVQLPTRPN